MIKYIRLLLCRISEKSQSHCTCCTKKFYIVELGFCLTIVVKSGVYCKIINVDRIKYKIIFKYFVFVLLS